MIIKVRESIDDDVKVLPAILNILPDNLSAWVSGGNAIIYDKDVEIARVVVRALDPDEAVAKVRKALKGVI